MNSESEMTVRIIALITGLFLSAPMGNVTAEPEVDAPYPCRPITKPIDIDGKLFEDDWMRAQVVTEFTGTTSALGTPPLKSELRFLHDTNALYVGFRAFSKDLSRLVCEYRKDGDSVWRDDGIELFVQPRLSRRSQWQICINIGPYVTVFNPRREQSGRGRVVEDVAVGQEKNAWTMEAKIPWRSIGGSSSTGKPIGVSIMRDIMELGFRGFYAWGNIYRPDQSKLMICTGQENLKAYKKRLSRFLTHSERLLKVVQEGSNGLEKNKLPDGLEDDLKQTTTTIASSQKAIDALTLDPPGPAHELSQNLQGMLENLRRRTSQLKFAAFFD